MEELNEIISKNLINLRQKSGMTQLQVAEKINYSDKSISKWERGDAIPDIPVMLQLAKLYGVTIDDIVSKHEKKDIKPKAKKIKLSQHTVITIIAMSFVWFFATIAFAAVYALFNLPTQAYLAFIVAIPVSFLVLMIFSFCWYPYYLTAVFCSAFIWTTVLAITLCISAINIWLLYIIVVPVQLIVILSFVLQIIIKRSKKNIK